jgi:hypothetical protein
MERYGNFPDHSSYDTTINSVQVVGKDLAQMVSKKIKKYRDRTLKKTNRSRRGFLEDFFENNILFFS